MPSINHILIADGWESGAGADYFFPPNTDQDPRPPHLHLRVNNGEQIVEDLQGIRPHVVYLGLTFADPQNNLNVDIMPVPENNEDYDNMKDDLSNRLLTDVEGNDGVRMQRRINLISGIGVDI